MIAGRGLAGEDLHARRPVPFRVRADLIVQRHRLDEIEQLALVFVDALDLHVEQGVRIDADGLVGIDLGVYGVPETFVVDKQGVIRYKQIGPVTPEVLRDTILPLVKTLSES